MQTFYRIVAVSTISGQPWTLDCDRDEHAKTAFQKACGESDNIIVVLLSKESDRKGCERHEFTDWTVVQRCVRQTKEERFSLEQRQQSAVDLTFAQPGQQFATRAGWTATIKCINGFRVEGVIDTDYQRGYGFWRQDGTAEMMCDDLVEKL